ncbi:hypothetical protein CNMCM5793_009077 [Aspergillus hiratsukae]|uniref:Uncharacterized protein n=1 Tax=Aspergillus hiratsukae TaxID=1194566 RepID=A0A8H6UHC3_9EURO|nr:hypothetical protein CNMCM5793_009077 [Aspergillus hiratsukae]
MAPSSRSRCGSSRLNPLFKFRQGALRDILRWDGGDEGEDYGRSASLLCGDAGNPAGVPWAGPCIETAPVGLGEG